MNPALQAKLNSLSANQKKLSALLMLVAVGLLLWGRLLWTHPVPRVATAQPVAPAPLPVSLAPVVTAAPPGRPQVHLDLPTDLCRDLFAPAIAPPGAGQGKSPPQPADEFVQTLPDTKSLTLQSTLLGQPPRALINGHLLLPGDRINGFILRRIMRRAVILEMNGIEVRLGM